MIRQTFKTHFERTMINKDFESFKKSHPTLLKAIMNAMEDVANQSYTIEDIERAVNHWSMTTVEKENIIKFLEK
jgi:hypothetical protein